ncbi:MFS transporter [Aliikangiella coralliicola]|uniref:MFS transporter n=1 Tax=Aliikangiella coralliicola TaxID=2592383 RepID=A0A545U0E0_9GAMM|nr:MFS transporter [Aliikangiella coralliicola]TQV82937.1 MFS transporter [Aliikangiella coralliicola]
MSVPTLAARIRTEMATWTSLAFALALLEGGVVGVLIKNGFNGLVSDWLLNLSVAIATGAPFYSNLVSFIWVKISHGRDKAKVVSDLAVICCLCTFGISFISFSAVGLCFLLVLLIVARTCWSGIMTIRSPIWRANYPRYIRGKVTAKLATFASLLMSIAAIFAGWVLDWNFQAFQWLYIGFAILSLAGAYRYRFLSVRHQQKSISMEQTATQKISFAKIFSVLKNNKPFARYMLSMFVLGSGNLMFMAPLIVYLNEYTELSKSSQILITTAIPLALIPVAVGWWARLLDGNHIFHYRSIHSWGFVLALVAFVVAQLSGIDWLFFIGACCYGIAISGGVIGWNLGHNDFVGNASPMEYMAVHVTLTGVRGLIMPLIGISFYQWLESLHSGYGKYALLLPLSITTTGGLLFVWFNRQFQLKTN